VAKKTLLIVESPAKAKTIQKYVGSDYDVVASKGHIKDLPKSGGVDIEHGFQETYVPIQERGKDEIIHSITKKAKTADRVLLATDPDREGEAIAWHLMEEVKKTREDVPVARVLFNEITKKGVSEGLQHPRELDTRLYEAQRTRRVLDRIGGYPLSNLLWKKLAFGLSAGRVQTPALRLIVDRQHEIDSFVPQPYWLLETRLRPERPAQEQAKHDVTALLESVQGEKLPRVASRPAATSEHDAMRYAADLRGARYQVRKITKREQRRRAPAPYTTSKLQQDASNRLGMAPKRTMSVAQGLYEGVELGKGGGTEGLITYMRTDSVRISPDAVNECRAYIQKTYGNEFLPAQPNLYKSGKQNVQDAHEAIRPTRMDMTPDRVRKFLKDDQFRLYRLIWDRFVACQMVPAVYDQTSVEIEASHSPRTYGLKLAGSVLKFAGWRQVYGVTQAPELAGEEESGQGGEDAVREDGLLPELREGEVLTLVDPPGVSVHAKETEPPPYFNEASLVKKLEEEGIGRPSTYAEIISKVQARDYVHKDGAKLVPSALGKLVIEKLVQDEFDLADIGFTRKLEEDLDAVAEARAKRLDVLAPFHQRLQQQIAHALEHKGKWWPEPEPLEEPCPECGGVLTKRWGRNGQFIGCTQYPTCKYTRNIAQDGHTEEPVEVTDIKCAECGAPMLKRSGRNGQFLGCSKYPTCKYTRNLPLGVDCPKCGGEVVEVRAKTAKGRGRPFYGCANYNQDPPCDFRLWQRPIPSPCPQCHAKFLVQATGKNAGGLRCVTEGCGYTADAPSNTDRAAGSAAGSATDSVTRTHDDLLTPPRTSVSHQKKAS
jgi:DNA topoisomerase-1